LRQIPQLFPFIKETADGYLKPLGVHLKKKKPGRNVWKINALSQEESPLESLLPPKDDTDLLVSFYLNHFEQLHRFVHVPTFKREYAKFWVPGRTRYPAMISISTPASVNSGEASIPSTYETMPVQWISACDEWLRQ
jgi:hypothetical protein